MKTRFLLILLAVFVCQSLLSEDTIRVLDPETWSVEELGPYVGKTVVFAIPMVVTSNYSTKANTTTQDYTISTRRLFTPTNQEAPYNPQTSSPLYNLNKVGAMQLTGCPRAVPMHRCGEKIYNLKVKVNSPQSVSWQSGEWRGNTREELEAGIPDLGDYRLLVCGMNLEYYLATDFPSSGTMGPHNQAQHDKQRKKVIKALTRINADVYGLVEVQQGPDALREIAQYLTESLPGRSYTFISDATKVNGTYTKSGYVYDRTKVRPVGAMQNIEEKVQNRKKMQCFEELATGERFIFSINHFKAKTRSNATGGDSDRGDGQGTFNATRQAESLAVISAYKKYRKNIIDRDNHNARITDKDILIMGDLNAYAMEDPISIFKTNGMIDLHRAFHADSSYSYQFSGLAGYLDHALCNSTLYPQVTGVAGFHINSDENDGYTYNGDWSDETMFRCSDHDPVLVGLKLDNTLTYDPNPSLAYGKLADETEAILINNAFQEGQKSYYAIYDIYGRLITSADSHPIQSTTHPIEMPKAPGVYIVYIYYDRMVYQKKIIVK